MRSTFLRLLALLMVFGLVAAACSSSSDDEVSTDEADAPAPADEPADAPAEAPADEPAEESGLPDLGGRDVTIAVENAYLPFNYIDAADGEAKGWDYDSINAMCELLNCNPVYQTFGWDGMIQAVSDGQFDMAADGITITEERAEVVAFSNGYINIDQRVLVGTDSTLADAAAVAADGCKVGSQPGTTNYDKAVEIVGEDRVQGFETFGFAVQALITGDVCAVFIDETAGQGYLGENSESVMLVGESLSSDELGFIFPLDSIYVDAFNYAIDFMKADGSAETLAQKYFGDAFTISYDDITFPE
jgi:polar amino acid transport system substrate-binding protein